MRLYSTDGERGVSFKEGVFRGFAADGGLYLPEKLPSFSYEFFKRGQGLSFLELSIELGSEIFKEELSRAEVEQLFEEAFTFPMPLVAFPENRYVLELFHGPTLSFKDVGAQFLAALLRYWRGKHEQIYVFVATSGDTGSAVASAFLGKQGLQVFILFPKGRVTPAQKQQLTTFGHNVTSIEIDGSFEQCQDLLKQAVLDKELKERGGVTVANSINIARLLPQSLYYFYAFCQLPELREVIFSVPSGNFGHLISGILAKKMGLPIHRFLAATNINDEVPIFLHSGVFQPHSAYPTLAVSMDVGNPSNFPRLLALYNGSLENLRKDIVGCCVTDEQIGQAVRQLYKDYGYLMDPHSATAFLVLNEYLKIEKSEHPGIFFATAHPAKFKESLNQIISAPIHVPERLSETLRRESSFLALPPSFSALKEIFYEKSKI